MKSSIKVDDLRLAGVRYYSKENKGVLLSDNLAYAFLKKDDSGNYSDIFSPESNLPIFERIPYSNSRRNGESYGSKMNLVNQIDETGPCYVIIKKDLKEEFQNDEITMEMLEKYILNSKHYFKDRSSIAKKYMIYNPVNYLRILVNDEKKEREMEKFFSEEGYQYKKSR